MSANGDLAVVPSGVLLVHGTDLSPGMVLTDYDPIDRIWDDSRNRNLMLVAEFHEALMMRSESYAVFYRGLSGVCHDQFITALALALGSDPQSYSAPDQLVTAGVQWCIGQKFSYDNHGGFLETRDWLRSDGVEVFLGLSERFGEVLERNTPNPRIISASQDPATRGAFGDVPAEVQGDTHQGRVPTIVWDGY